MLTAGMEAAYKKAGLGKIMALVNLLITAVIVMGAKLQAGLSEIWRENLILNVSIKTALKMVGMRSISRLKMSSVRLFAVNRAKEARMIATNMDGYLIQAQE